MAQRGRPVEFPIKKLVALNDELLDAIEVFRAQAAPPINQSEAIRKILRDWLIGNGYLSVS
ncbi:hypothetical protein [Rhizobium redzepovicii]|uniref:hypothetical protein n=1 Tax=Rhizobium redzepovicii TaxID=2867518 RepID=UPI001C92CB33|nr:hypothetical protein [Rhizobium redzepovicii]MBY4589503.1 hypothetical protein [Rhizobium redzepovicii]